MNTNIKELMDNYFKSHNFPFILEQVNEDMFAAGAELTFTARPFKDDIFVHSVMVDDEFTSVCAFYTVIEDVERFEEIADLLIDRYGGNVMYDRNYSAIKASVSVGESFFEEESIDEMDKTDLMLQAVTFPVLICRMAACAYFDFEDSDLSAEETVELITNDENWFLCPDFINYDIEHNSAISEGDERYFVEHIFLPDIFHSDPKGLISNIRENPMFLEVLVEEMLEDNNAALIPGYNNFRYETLFENEDGIAIDIVLPQTEKTNDCTDIVLFCSESKGANFYTVELDTYTGKKEFHSCSWSDSCEHSNYGASKTRDEALKVIKKIICG